MSFEDLQYKIKSVDDINNISFHTIFRNGSFSAHKAQRDMNKIYVSLFTLCDEVNRLK